MALHPVAAAVIALVVLFAVYLVVGCVVRYRSGLHHCPEVLPNYQLWCRLANALLRLVTCGRYRGSTLGVRSRDYLWSSGVGAGGGGDGGGGASGGLSLHGITVLPGRLGAMSRDVRFETLLSDDDFDYAEVDAMRPQQQQQTTLQLSSQAPQPPQSQAQQRGMQPASVVVNY